MSTAIRKGGFTRKAGGGYADANGNPIPWEDVYAIECGALRQGFILDSSISMGVIEIMLWLHEASRILKAGTPKPGPAPPPRKTLGRIAV